MPITGRVPPPSDLHIAVHLSGPSLKASPGFPIGSLWLPLGFPVASCRCPDILIKCQHGNTESASGGHILPLFTALNSQSCLPVGITVATRLQIVLYYLLMTLTVLLSRSLKLLNCSSLQDIFWQRFLLHCCPCLAVMYLFASSVAFKSSFVNFAVFVRCVRVLS